MKLLLSMSLQVLKLQVNEARSELEVFAVTATKVVWKRCECLCVSVNCPTKLFVIVFASVSDSVNYQIVNCCSAILWVSLSFSRCLICSINPSTPQRQYYTIPSLLLFFFSVVPFWHKTWNNKSHKIVKKHNKSRPSTTTTTRGCADNKESWISPSYEIGKNQ